MSSMKPYLITASNNTLTPLQQEIFSVGRSLSNDLVLNELFVSRKHFEINSLENRWFLKSLGANKTYINGECLEGTEPQTLEDGDTISIRFNESVLEFVFQLLPDDWSEDDFSGKKLVPNAIDSIEISCDDNCDHCSKGQKTQNALIKNAGASSACSSPRTKRMRVDKNKNVSTLDGFVQKLEKPGSSNIKLEEDKTVKLEDDKTALNNPTCSKNVDTDKQVKCKVETFNELEDDLVCSVCSELFIKTVTLNCAHSFCNYCIARWKKNSSTCPICRLPITSMNSSLVLDNIIGKMLENSTEEEKSYRKKIVELRQDTSESTSKENPTVDLLSQPESESSSDSLDGSDSSYNDAFFFSDDDFFEIVVESAQSSYNGIPGRYYGGYGRCYNCQRRGHWANGCPYR